MAKFITGKDLENAVSEIIWEAKQTLLIVSPFIKLDNYFKRLFDEHKNNPEVHLVIVFGKNEGMVSRSLSNADFEFFTKFLNVSIIYVPNLHAKYYGNEKKGLITSINLYDYSFLNNIEFGVLSEGSFLLNNFTTTTDQQAWETCWKIAKDNEVVFIKRPVYEKKLLSALLGKNYVKSDVLYDSTQQFYAIGGRRVTTTKRLSDFPDVLDLGSKPSIRPTREEVEQTNHTSRKIQIGDIKILENQSNSLSPTNNYRPSGYCIRTGVEIPFNVDKPLSFDAYKAWNKYGDKDYSEKYCHLTGELSNGETSVRHPILRKNRKKASEIFGIRF
jgi:hypothetical protein